MLYLVPTPIGNLQDVTLRSLDLFKKAEIIICEDSRQTRKLFDLLDIDNKPRFVDITRNHKLNFHAISEVLHLLHMNQTLEHQDELIVLLVSDSGTPGLSDPGVEIINLAKEMDVKYTVLPGANSLVPAVIGSGLVSKEFWFVGFLPIKRGRQTLWQKMAVSSIPVVLFESVHRLAKFQQEALQHLDPEQQLCLFNDISKLYERRYELLVKDLETFETPTKGEFVIIIRPLNPLSSKKTDFDKS